MRPVSASVVGTGSCDLRLVDELCPVSAVKITAEIGDHRPLWCGTESHFDKLLSPTRS